jgi:hypothetical protein
MVRDLECELEGELEQSQYELESESLEALPGAGISGAGV